MPKKTLLFVCAINNAFKNKGTEQRLFIYLLLSIEKKREQIFLSHVKKSTTSSYNVRSNAATQRDLRFRNVPARPRNMTHGLRTNVLAPTVRRCGGPP